MNERTLSSRSRLGRARGEADGQPVEARDTAERIRLASIELFRTRGYSGTSTRDIAARAGITVGSLYNHYESKQALLFAILKGSHAEALDRLRVALEENPAPPARAVWAAVHSHVLFHAEHPAAVSVAYQDMEFLEPAHRAAIVGLRREYEGILVGLIEAGVAAGELTESDPRLAAIAILSMGVRVAAWFRPNGRLGAGEVANRYATYALRLLGASSPPGSGDDAWAAADRPAPPEARISPR